MTAFTIVGAGLFGATVACRLTDAGHRCRVIEKREHVGGNCYTEMRNGTIVHVYGVHYFHTSSEEVWRWVNRFGAWRTFVPRVKATARGSVYSMPINLMTLNQLWGVTTPAQARKELESRKLPIEGADAEAYLLRTVGQELYERFFCGYTTKQWRKPPRELPSSIVARLPVRLSFDDSYHDAVYQALPVGGYTPVVEAMLNGIPVELGTDFRPSRSDKNVIYTGPIDALYGQQLGKLEYRSLRFVHEALSISDFQGCAQMNYTDLEVPYTRIIEHRHLHGGVDGSTYITREYPADNGEPYYPITTSENVALARKYRAQAESDGYIVGGRLGLYKYIDMDAAIAAALRMADRIIG
jgi:UDP-galactopyranose mutase